MSSESQVLLKIDFKKNNCAFSGYNYYLTSCGVFGS